MKELHETENVAVSDKSATQNSMAEGVVSAVVVTIPRDEYIALIYDAGMLACLRAKGVGNWEGYKDAIDLFEAEYRPEVTLAENMRKAA